MPLDASWPLDEGTRALLRYTGYVDHGMPVAALANDAGEIVVSGGSSAASLPLYRASLAAAALVPERPWRILVGGAAEAELETLVRAAPAHAVVERARGDFRDLLAGGRRFGQPGRLQHGRRRAARRMSGRAGAVRGGQRDRAAAARRTAGRPRPRRAAPRDELASRRCRGRRAPRPAAARAPIRQRSGSTAPNGALPLPSSLPRIGGPTRGRAAAAEHAPPGRFSTKP